jgi:hypothetical protein
MIRRSHPDKRESNRAQNGTPGRIGKGLLGRFAGHALCVMGSSAVYLLTLGPTIQGFDSAELTVGAHALGFVHAPGYPLYMLLGHGFSKLPLADVAVRLNLMSAVFASLTVLMLLCLLQRNTDSSSYAFPSVLLFATAPVFWSQALRAEVYTLQTFLMVSVLYLWRRAHQSGRKLWYPFCFLLLGLAMGNHSTTLLLWATLLICLVWASPAVKWLGAAGTALGLMATATVYLYFPIRSQVSPAVDYIGAYFSVDVGSPKGIWWLLSTEMFQRAFYLDPDLGALLHQVLRFGMVIWDNFLGVGAILGVWGWWRLRRREPVWNRLLSIYFGTNLAAFVCYHVVDKEVMFIPAYAICSLWISSGVKGLVEWASESLQVPATTEVRAFVVSVLLLVVGLGSAFNWREVSLHDSRRAYEFVSQLLTDVKPSTLLVNHWVTASVVDYVQMVEGRRPDVQSFNLDFYNLALEERHDSLDSAAARAEWHAWIERRVSQRPLCFVEPLPSLPCQYSWLREGLCWRPVPVP